MRADVKLGMAISAVVVLVAGGYFTFRDRPDNTLPLAGVLAAPAGGGSKPLPQRTKPAPNNPQAHKTPSSQPPRRAQGAVRPKGRTTPNKAARGDVGTATGAAQKAVNSGKTKGQRKAAVTPHAGGERRASAASKQRGATGKAGTRALGSAPGKITRGKPPAGTSSDAKPKTVSPTLATPRPGAKSSAVQQRTPSKSAKKRSPLSASRGGSRTPPKVPARTRVDHGAATDIHHVQAGDTFTSLALMYYGSVKHTGFLVGSNPQISDPDRLRIGATVKIPPLPPTGALSPARSTGHVGKRTGAGKQRGGDVAKTYIVQSGDTFYGIARDVLGSSARWKELFEFNRELVGGDPKSLQVGTTLRLPKS